MKKMIISVFVVTVLIINMFFSTIVMAEEQNDQDGTVPYTREELRTCYMNSPEFLMYLEADPVNALDMLDRVIDNTIQSYKNGSGGRTAINEPSFSASQDDNLCYSSVYMPLVQQAANNFCGPACAQMAIYGWGSYVIGNSNYQKQDLLSQYMHFSIHGYETVVYELRDTLNIWLGWDGYGNTYDFYLGSTLSANGFCSYVNTSLTHNRAPILHAVTTPLNYYGGSTQYHYIAVAAYNSSNGTITLYDPNYNSTYYGAHMVPYTQAYQAINYYSNRYLICNGQ